MMGWIVASFLIGFVVGCIINSLGNRGDAARIHELQEEVYRLKRERT